MAQPPPYHSAPPSRAFSPPVSASSPNAPPSGSFFPPAKRQRITPNPQSPPYGSPNFSDAPLPSVGSPVNGFPFNTAYPPPAPPGSMGPPSRPPEKELDLGHSFDEAIAGTGVNLEEEQANLMNSSQSREPSHGQFSFGAHHANAGTDLGTNNIFSSNRIDGLPDINSSADPFGGSDQDLAEIQEDWRAGSRRQHHLTDLFLEGQTLENKISSIAYEQKLKTVKDGLFYATQGRPPQRTQVEAPDGSTEVIDKGQTILDSNRGSTLIPLMTLVSLACKMRVTGLVDRASRLAYERKNFSMGRVPLDWHNIAAIEGNPPANSTTAAASTEARSSIKSTNTHAGFDSKNENVIAPNRMAEYFRKVSEADRKAEEARLAKRAKRKSAAITNDAGVPSSTSTPGPSTPLPTPSEPEKRPTKKAMKAAEAKFTEAQQQKSSNETVRMATGGISGRFGKKQYSWLQSNKTHSPSPPAATSNVNINMSLEDDAPRQSNATTKPPTVRPARQFGEWNEEAEQQSRGIRLRDLLLVLEGDGKATKALLRAYNLPDEVD
ncbi:MAG: hypothetical protein Q9160_002719 [Pyrenula sp. 1 TL-2023]